MAGFFPPLLFAIVLKLNSVDKGLSGSANLALLGTEPSPLVLGEKCFDISKVDVRTQNEFVRIVRMKVKDEFLEKEIRRRKGNRF